MKVILKCIVATKEKKKEEVKKEEGGDELMPAVVATDKKKKKQNSEDEGNGSRSNHQRLQAVELLNHLIKDCRQHASSRKLLTANIELIAQVIVSTVDTADSWKNKKVTKTS